MTFSYSAAWDDTVRMLRAHGSLIGGIAGVFVFLPAVLMSYLLPLPEQQTARMLEQTTAYFTANLHWFILSQLIEMTGLIAILLLVFRPSQDTVGGAIGRAFRVLPLYFLAVFLSRVVIGAGLFFLMIPGLYLFGRLALVPIVVVAEEKRNPIDAMQRSFALTRGRGWAILGLFLVVVIAGFVCVLAVTAVVGLVLLLFGEVGKLLQLILNSALTSVLRIVLLLLGAAVYRQIAPDRSAGVFN
jgi:hypothetical protein